IDVRSLIEASTICIATVFVAAYLYREDRDSTIELLLVFRWYDTWQEHRKGAVGVPAAQNLEYDVHSGLQLGHCLLVIVHRTDRLAVDLGNHVAAAEAKVVRDRKSTRLNSSH